VFQSIVVGTDGSETARKAVDAAVELARLTGARLELVSAYEPVTSQRLRAEARPAWRRAAGRARAIPRTRSST
jgi:nucleotide-binding universal stress UspA family protein